MNKLTEEQKADLLKGLQQISAEYYKTVIEILVAIGDQDELNYIRTPIHMPNGSKYLLALLHTGGPVLSLEKLRNGGYDDLYATAEQTNITSKDGNE